MLDVPADAQLPALRAALSGATSGIALGAEPVTTPRLGTVLDAHFAARPILVRDVHATADDTPERLAFTGTSEILGATMDVDMTATWSSELDLRVVVRPPDDWRFGAAAGSALDGSKPAVTPLLDGLQELGALGDVTFTLAACDDGADPDGVLAADPRALGVTATLRPGMFSGVARVLLGDTELPLHGAVVAAGDGAAAGGADDGDRWPAGLTLVADLGTTVPVGPFWLADAQVRVRAPFPATSTDAEPTLVVTGALHATEDIALDVVVDVSGDGDGFVVTARPIEPMVGTGLDDLAADGTDARAMLPASLRDLVDGAELSLESLLVDARRDDEGALRLRNVEPTVAVGASWTVVEDVLVVDDVRMSVGRVVEGEDEGATLVRVGGTAHVAGVGCEVTAEWPAALVTARMLPGETIALGRLLGDLLPGVQAPVDLTVTDLTLTVAFDPVVVTLEATLADSPDFAVPLGHTSLALTGVRFAASIGGASSSGELSGVVAVGGTSLAVTASGATDGGWAFRGELSPGSTVSLAAVLSALLPTWDVPSALSGAEVTDLSLSWDTDTAAVEFTGGITSTWDVDLGPLQKSVTVGVHVRSEVDSESGERRTTGSVVGELDLGTTTFTLEYDASSTSTVLRGSLKDDESIDFADLADALGLPLSDLPDVDLDLDLELRELAFELVTASTIGTGLVFRAESTTFGSAFVAVRRDAKGEWGFVLGLEVPEDMSPADLPGVGTELVGLDWLTFDEAVLLLASRNFAELSLSDAPVLGRMPADVGRGLSFCAVVDLDGADPDGGGSGSAELARLGTVTGRSALLLQLSGAGLVAELGDLTIGTEGQQLRISDAKVKLLSGPNVAVAGTVALDLDGEHIEAMGQLAVGADGIGATLLVRSDRPLATPMGFKGVHLMEIGVLVDLTFAPPALGFGLTGHFVIGDPPAPGSRAALPAASTGASSAASSASGRAVALRERPSDYRFAVAAAVTAGTVVPQLLSMTLSEISMRKLTRAVLDEDVSLPAVLDGVNATDVLLYAAKESKLLPDGSVAEPGFGFTADLDLWGFHAHADLRIDKSTGVVGTACTDPIDIAGVLRVVGGGKGTVPGYVGSRGVAAGGPFVHISTVSSPYFQLSTEVVLLSTFRQKVEVEVTDKGFQFDLNLAVGTLDGTAPPALASSLHCGLYDRGRRFDARLSIALDLNVDIGFKLPPLHIVSAGADVTLDAAVGDYGVAVGLAATFVFEGTRYTLPRVALPVVPSSVAELPGLLAARIGEVAWELFADLIAGLRKIYELGERAVKNIAAGVETAVKGIEQGADIAVAAVEGAAEDAVRFVGREADDAIEGLKSTAVDLLRQGEDLRNDISAAADDVVDTVNQIGHQADRVASAVGDVAAEAAAGVVSTVEDIGSTVNDVVSDVGRTFESVGQTFSNAFSWSW